MTGTTAGLSRGRASAGVDDPWAPRWIDLAVVVGVTAVAWWLRAPGLEPSSLWLDDAWVAVVHRTDTLQELRWVGLSAPGFALLLKTWLGIVGFSEVAAQAPSFAAGVAAPGLAHLVARRQGWGVAAGVTAAAVLATSPIAMVYATRVKPYTVEAVVCIGLVALALWASRGSRRRWAVFTAGGLTATAFSAFAAPYVAAGFAAGAVAAVRARPRDGPRGDARWWSDPALGAVVAGAAVYGVLALVWYLAVLRPVVTAQVQNFWSEHTLTWGAGFLGSLLTALTGLAEGLAPTPPAATLLVLAAALLVTASTRPVTAVLLATPTVVAVVLAALELAPLGGGRTDLYLYPGLALLLAAGVHGIAVLARWQAALAAASAMVLALGLTAGPAPSYPASDVGPLVEELDARRSNDAEVVVYPATMWAYALYTTVDLRLVADPASSWGFAPRFDDPHVHTLPPGRDDPSVYAPTLDALEADEVWLIASHWRGDYDELRRMLEAAGFAPEEAASREGAELIRYLRR